MLLRNLIIFKIELENENFNFFIFLKESASHPTLLAGLQVWLCLGKISVIFIHEFVRRGFIM